MTRDFLAEVTHDVKVFIVKYFKKLRDLKVNLMLICDYKKGKEMQEFNFKTPNSVITEAIDLTDHW